MVHKKEKDLKYWVDKGNIIEEDKFLEERMKKFPSQYKHLVQIQVK